MGKRVTRMGWKNWSKEWIDWHRSSTSLQSFNDCWIRGTNLLWIEFHCTAVEFECIFLLSDEDKKLVTCNWTCNVCLFFSRNYIISLVLISGVTGGGGRGGIVPPQTSDWEIFAGLPGKKEARKKWKRVEMEKKRRKIVKRKKEGGKSWEMRRRGFFFFFFFYCFSLFKTPKICFGATKIEIFYREKSISRWEKNQEKWLCLLEKFSCYAPGTDNRPPNYNFISTLSNLFKLYNCSSKWCNAQNM